MLDFDYPQHYAAVVQQTPWTITLPETWIDYFHETGVMPNRVGEQRSALRRIVRTVGLLRIDEPLPAIPRTGGFIGVYTRDFSKNAVGLLSPIQLYPGETVRLVLPTFWLKLQVARCLRHNEKCYEVGAELNSRHDPDRLAFAGTGVRPEPVRSYSQPDP
jgi:hypothetical protein